MVAQIIPAPRQQDFGAQLNQTINGLSNLFLQTAAMRESMKVRQQAQQFQQMQFVATQKQRGIANQLAREKFVHEQDKANQPKPLTFTEQRTQRQDAEKRAFYAGIKDPKAPLNPQQAFRAQQLNIDTTTDSQGTVRFGETPVAGPTSQIDYLQKVADGIIKSKFITPEQAQDQIKIDLAGQRADAQAIIRRNTERSEPFDVTGTGQPGVTGLTNLQKIQMETERRDQVARTGEARTKARGVKELARTAVSLRRTQTKLLGANLKSAKAALQAAIRHGGKTEFFMDNLRREVDLIGSQLEAKKTEIIEYIAIEFAVEQAQDLINSDMDAGQMRNQINRSLKRYRWIREEYGDEAADLLYNIISANLEDLQRQRDEVQSRAR